MKPVIRLVLLASLLTAVFAVTAPAFADNCQPRAVTRRFDYLCTETDGTTSESVTPAQEDSANATQETTQDAPAQEEVADLQYVQHEAPEDSLFGRRWYGRLADNANVYAEPSLAAPIVRNVGDGYLFATVNRWFNNDAGEKWYEINYGEFVQDSDIDMVEPSEFSGIEINTQPERPFGWIVARDVYPSNEPDGEPDESLEKLTRYTVFEIYDTVLGAEDWLWYNIGDGRWVKQTFFSIVTVDPRPEGVGEDEYWVEVDLYEQTFAAYEGDQMVYATLISSGLNRWPTREGLFQVEQRYDEYKMSGAEGLVDYYFLEDIPYIMYFDMFNGIALHGTYWHDRFGYKHSHGCVNMSILDAEWTYRWSDEGPNELWVMTHTSDPTSILAQVQ